MNATLYAKVAGPNIWEKKLKNSKKFLKDFQFAIICEQRNDDYCSNNPEISSEVISVAEPILRKLYAEK